MEAAQNSVPRPRQQDQNMRVWSVGLQSSESGVLDLLNNNKSSCLKSNRTGSAVHLVLWSKYAPPETGWCIPDWSIIQTQEHWELWIKYTFTHLKAPLHKEPFLTVAQYCTSLIPARKENLDTCRAEKSLHDQSKLLRSAQTVVGSHGFMCCSLFITQCFLWLKWTHIRRLIIETLQQAWWHTPSGLHDTRWLSPAPSELQDKPDLYTVIKTSTSRLCMSLVFSRDPLKSL